MGERGYQGRPWDAVPAGPDTGDREFSADFAAGERTFARLDTGPDVEMRFARTSGPIVRCRDFGGG